MGNGVTAAGGRTARVLRLLVLIVLALVTYEYLFGWMLGTKSIRSYLYDPHLNTIQIDVRNAGTQLINEPPINSTNTSNTPNNSSSTKVGVGNGVSTEPQKTTTEEDRNKTEPVPPYCDNLPPGLGPVPVNKTELELAFVEKKFPELKLGGRYTPKNCTARHKVAIIVPYRDREQHLAIFLNHMHPFLMKQQIEYGIFVIEQEGGQSFNRAKLMNVGFVESEKLEPGGWQCFIFHDIDLLPLDTRNMYTCPEKPRHMSAAVDKFKYKLPYKNIFGGVSALTKEQFTKVNGFSNKYWGWGGEDDDMFKRLNSMHYQISRYDMEIAKYVMLDHKKSKPNPQRLKVLSKTDKIFQTDGLSTLQYELIKMARYHSYTYIEANIDELS